MDHQNLLVAQAFDHNLLKDVIERLSYNQFISGKQFNLNTREISNEELKKSIWIASILAISTDGDHQTRAQRFTTLLYLQFGHREEIERLAYVLMSRLGNLTATNLFKSLNSNRKLSEIPLFDSALTYELAAERDCKTITLQDDILLATRFQKDLWDNLSSAKRVAISAPTSAGKSFIVKKKIKELFSVAGEPKHCLYIVPSRALINQVSDEFRAELGGIANVFTSFLDPVIEKSSIYILTPERCLRLIKSTINTPLKLDLIFVDEIQNIEEEGGRGTLMEYVVDILNTSFPDAQLVVAGPFLENPGGLFKELFRNSAFAIKTLVSPVIQIKSIIRGSDSNQISVSLDTAEQDKSRVYIDVGFDLNKALGQNIGVALSRLVRKLAKDEHSIIYSPKTNLAESWARHCADREGELTDIHSRVLELIEYLSEEIHPKYYLIKCLKSGVAFHHGRLPDMVRKEVEDNFKEKRINSLFCTSTLIEGVNLPAKNLFIIKPEKSTDELTSFEFGNLIGRSGRLGESLYGNVFCIEQPEHYDWAQKYFDKKVEKTVVPATSKALQSIETLLANAHKPSTEFARDQELVKNCLIIFRQKLLNGEANFDQYLEEKGLSSEDAKELRKAIATPITEITLPVDVCKNNPSVDPILQEVLYKRIIEEGIDTWVVHPNAGLRVPMKKDDAAKLEVKERNLYYQLVDILTKMNEIFDVKNETGYKYQIYKTIPQMCLYGVRWLAGDSYSKMVQNDIDWKVKTATEEYPFNQESDADVNHVINDLAKINNTIVSHVLVKYLKLLNDLLEKIMNDSQIEQFKFSLGLPGMLELGTTNGSVIKLITVGVSRSVAIKVVAIFEKINGHEELEIIHWLKSQKFLNLKPIYNRYLYKLKLLNTETDRLNDRIIN